MSIPTVRMGVVMDYKLIGVSGVRTGSKWLVAVLLEIGGRVVHGGGLAAELDAAIDHAVFDARSRWS